MWNLDNQCVLISFIVLVGLIISYKTFENLRGSAILLLAVIIGYFMLIINHTDLITLYAIIIEYIKKLIINIYKLLRVIHANTVEIFQIIQTFYRNNIVERMERRRRGTYQLSSDLCEASKKETGRLSTSPIKGLSPIPRGNLHSYTSNFSTYESRRFLDKVTSTPLIHWDSRRTKNNDVASDVTSVSSYQLKKTVSSFSSNPNITRNHETSCNSPGSPWGLSISPKMRSPAMGVQTVQTIAGPLLASTRYNIDHKTYADVRSPGLTSRLTKYATEANTKLIHQSQYRTGQFPKVNLKSSPVPHVNPKSTSLKTTPVKVRIAQPDTKYSPSVRQKILSDMCKIGKPLKTSPSVVQVLREISLKRHASRDDVSDFVKKQRTDGILSIESENFEEEITQKRSRDESSRSEDDTSIDKISIRPIKKTKKPSCNDVISSLSSSSNMMCGVKRKAEISRSDTPEMEKPYKTLKNSPRESIPPNISIEFLESNKMNMSESAIRETVSDCNTTSKSITRSENSSIQVINKSQSTIDIGQTNYMQLNSKSSISQIKKINVPVKLSERLFMKEETQNIDNLKILIKEREDTKVQFTKSGSDEIKKSDIVIMRQTSMKARLKSMFDAISGNVSSKINPSVVIRADKDDLTASSDPSLTDVPIITTLNSYTSTTNVNTSPILTSVISPIIGKQKDVLAPAKHVTFQASSLSSSPSTTLLTSSSIDSAVTISQQSIDVKKTVSTTESFPQSSILSSGPSSNISTTLLKTSVTTSVTVSSKQTPAASVMPTFGFNTSETSLSTTTAATTTTMPAPSFSLTNMEKNSSAISGFSLPALTTSNKIPTTLGNPSPSTSSTTSFSTNNSQPASFSFGSTSTSYQVPKTTESSATSLTTQVNSASSTSIKPSGEFNFNSSTSNVFPTFGSSATTSSFSLTTTLSTATATTPAFSFGSSSSDKKGFILGAQITTTQTATTVSATMSFTSSPSISMNPGFPTASSVPAFGVTLSTSSPTLFTMSPVTSIPSFPTVTATSQNNSQQQKSLPSFTATSTTNLFSSAKITPRPSFGTAVTTTSHFFNTPTTSSTITETSLFGAGGKLVDQSVKQPLAFGGTSSTFGSNLVGLFSGNSTSNTTFGKSNSDEPTSSFSDLHSTTSTFKTTNSAPSVFGSSNANTLNVSGTNNITSSFNTSNGSTSLFQNATNTGFAKKNTSQSGFGASATGAFGTPSQPPPPFPGSNTSFSGFGSATTNTGISNLSVVPSAFGSQGFTSPSGGNNVTSPFTFGASQTSTSQSQAQQSNIFGFSGTGSNTDKSASGSSSLFQFGASQTPQSGQFNFSTNTPALPSTPSFSAPVPSAFGTGASPTAGGSSGVGMFSIGSGSTAPRRTIRQARRQR